MKCIVLHCKNDNQHGKFIGELCSPCHEFITKGNGVHSQAYRNEQHRTSKILEKCNEQINLNIYHNDSDTVRINSIFKKAVVK